MPVGPVPGAESAGEARSGRPGPSAPVVVGVAVLYGGLGLALAAIGGWVGIAGVFCLAGLVIAGVVVARIRRAGGVCAEPTTNASSV